MVIYTYYIIYMHGHTHRALVHTKGLATKKIIFNCAVVCIYYDMRWGGRSIDDLRYELLSH